MTSEYQGASIVGQRYAKALISLAEEEKKIDQVAQDLNDLERMLSQSSDLSFLIRSPRVSGSALMGVMTALTEKAKLQKITGQFLGVLVQNRRLSVLSDIIVAFKQEMAVRRGEVSVNVQVAQDMSEQQQKALQTALSSSMGAKVSLKLRVVPDILGGMIVTVGSRMMDDSVRRKLEKLSFAMGVSQKTGANENKISNINEVA